MLPTSRPITNSTLKNKLDVGSYSNTYTLSGSSSSTSISLTRVDTNPGALVFIPNTSVTLSIMWAFSASGTWGYNHGGTRLVSIWVDNSGTPTITYNAVVNGSFDGLTVQTQLDTKSGKHFLSLSLFGWGSGVTTHGSAVITSLVTVRT